MHWLYTCDNPRDPKFGIVKCTCQQGVDEERRRRYLEQMDGLNVAERALHFEQLLITDDNRKAIREISIAVERQRGLVTLTGSPGTGKSTLLMCAVNASRDANIPSVYTTVTDVLDYLRSAFDPDRPAALNFERRWELLIDAKVLALDELEEFSATPWAMERFQRLMDERWRSMHERLTILATNAPIERMPPKIASRLRDGRAAVVEMGGRDWRRVSGW